jgi:hypothetical protein
VEILFVGSGAGTVFHRNKAALNLHRGDAFALARGTAISRPRTVPGLAKQDEDFLKIIVVARCGYTILILDRLCPQ